MSAVQQSLEERLKTNPYEYHRTPPWKVWYLLYWLEELQLLPLPDGRGPDRVRILDPCAGDGSIVLELMHWARCTGVADRVEVIAYELNPAHQPSLWLILGPERVRVGDFLQAPAPARPVDLVLFNPPFSLSAEFLQRLRDYWLRPGGSMFMLQRMNWPCEVETGRGKLVEDSSPAAPYPTHRLGYQGKSTSTSRCRFNLKPGSDSINHSWFWFMPGHLPLFTFPIGLHRDRKPCRWDMERAGENPPRGPHNTIGLPAKERQGALFG